MSLAAPGYQRIALPLPYALRSVNAYVVEGDRLAIVDCGLHTSEGERAFLDGLDQLGRARRDVRDVFVTHLHPDHIGMAGWLESAGARVHMHGPEADAARAMWFDGAARRDEAREWLVANGMPPSVTEGMAEAWLEAQRRVDRIERIHKLDDGEVLDLAGRRLRLIWTPGHTDYHAVLHDERDRVLVGGDHVLPRITPNIGLYPWGRDDPLGDFLESLANVAALDVVRVLPAHGDPFDDLRGRVESIVMHHRVRLDAICEALATGPKDAYVVARMLFAVLRSPHEERFAHAEVLAHLRYLERRGRVVREPTRPVRWALAP